MATDSIIPTDTEQVFMSPIHNLRLVRIAENDEQLSTGIKRQINPGLRYEFDGNYLIVDDAVRQRDKDFFEKYGDILGPVDQAPAEEWLRAHGKFDVERGFVEIKPQAPSSSPELAQIANAAVAGDVDAIADLYEAEENGWKRPDVLETAKNALLQLEGREAPQPAA